MIKLKVCIEKTATDALGREGKFRSRQGLRLWNDEVEGAAKENKRA